MNTEDPTSAKIKTDQAMKLTFSEHTTAEHNGPIIQDIFENFPRPIYEFAQIVAKDMAEKEKKGSLFMRILILNIATAEPIKILASLESILTEDFLTDFWMAKIVLLACDYDIARC